MNEMASTIILAVLGSNALFAFLQFLISRADSKKSIKGKLNILEKDVLRTQLLLLILMRPEEDQEILTIAQHYFAELKGNWYMTSIFSKWLTETGTGKPEWFDSKQ